MTRRRGTQSGDEQNHHVQYLKFLPMESEEDVKKFYAQVDQEWRNGAQKYDVVIESTKKVSSLEEVREAARNLDKVMPREKGDCAHTAAAVLAELVDTDNAEWTVEHHRLVFYTIVDNDDDDDDDEDVDYEFEQNHEYVVVFKEVAKDWFRRGWGDIILKK